MNLKELFFSFVDLSQVHTDDDCWDWIGGVDGEQRARLWLNNKSERASRVSFELFKGPIPDGLWILHHCDCVGCVNPVHLYAGTHQDNMNDLANRNRSPWKYKISEQDIQTIKSSTLSQMKLAEQFGISQSMISNIRNNRRERYRKDKITIEVIL